MRIMNAAFMIVGLLLISVVSVMVPELSAEPENNTKFAADDNGDEKDPVVNPSPCADAAGYAGDTWDSLVSYNANEVVEHPSGSFQFYIAEVNVGAGIAPDSAGAVGRWIACDCEDIAVSWDSLFAGDTGYDQFAIVEYPIGSGSYYISMINDNSYVPGLQNQLEMWAPCGGDHCQDSSGFGGPWYDQSISNGAGYMMDDVVEYPIGSGMFYISTVDNNLMHPMTLNNWVECSCSDLYDGSSVATLYSPGNPITVNGAAPSPADNYLIVDVNGVLYLFWFNGGGTEGPELRLCTTDNCNPTTYWNIGNAAAGYYDVGVVVKTPSSWGSWNLLWTSQIENNGVFPPGTNGEWERCWPQHIALEPVKGEGVIVIDGPKEIENNSGPKFHITPPAREGEEIRSTFQADVFDAGGGKLVLSTTYSSTGVSISDADAGISGPGDPEDIKGCWVQVVDPYDGSMSAFWEDPCRVSNAVGDVGGELEDETEARSIGASSGASVETGCWVITTFNGQTVNDGETGKPYKEWKDPCPYSRSIQVDPAFEEVGCWVSATTWAVGECTESRRIVVDALPPIVVSACGNGVGQSWSTDRVECGARIVIPSVTKEFMGSVPGSIDSNNSDLPIAGPDGPEDETGCWVQVVDPYDGSMSAFWEDPCRVSNAVGDVGGELEDETEARSIGASSGASVETGCWVISTFNGQTVIDGETGKPYKEWIDPCPHGNIISNDFTLPDGTNVTAFYMLGKTCANFDLAEGASCEDAVVDFQIVEEEYTGCWVSVRNSDGSTYEVYLDPCDQVMRVGADEIREATDDDIIADSDDTAGKDSDSIPGFTGVIALTALVSMAVLMRRRIDS